MLNVWLRNEGAVRCYIDFALEQLANANIQFVDKFPNYPNPIIIGNSLLERNISEQEYIQAAKPWHDYLSTHQYLLEYADEHILLAKLALCLLGCESNWSVPETIRQTEYFIGVINCLLEKGFYVIDPVNKPLTMPKYFMSDGKIAWPQDKKLAVKIYLSVVVRDALKVGLDYSKDFSELPDPLWGARDYLAGRMSKNEYHHISQIWRSYINEKTTDNQLHESRLLMIKLAICLLFAFEETIEVFDEMISSFNHMIRLVVLRHVRS